MKVLMLSKALVVGAYQKKLEELARFPDLEIAAVVPPYWQEGSHKLWLERSPMTGYPMFVTTMALNGHFHLHFYPLLHRFFRDFRPDIVHADEEPYNLATCQALFLAKRYGAKAVFFSWQNILRSLPYPFGILEKYCYGGADYGIAGSQEAARVLRAKGFSKAIAIIPQFGVDSEVFSRRGNRVKGKDFIIGYVGRLVPQKGLTVLLRACAGLPGPWHLELVGAGPLLPTLESLAYELGIGERITFRPPMPSTQIPAFLNRLDVLVLPSLTTPNWKEQFGRALIEAMACEVPVIGSDSGEIPNTIGDAGLVVPEGDPVALRDALLELMESPSLQAKLARLGRERVLRYYTQDRIAEQTYQVYREMTG